MELLSVKEVSKYYANHCALDNVSLSIQEGEIYGLLGPNGAGKTSLIRIINQITAPDTGEITIAGQPLGQEHIAQIGYLPEERGLYKKMKVGEQAIYFARLKGMRKNEAQHRLKSWFEKFEIMPWWNRRVEELSKGMQQKVQFITTVLHQPRLLVFDEPFSGFDPINVNLLKKEILELRNQGATVIFSTHNMSSVEELCDAISLINKSKKILEGQLSEIKKSYKQHLYEVQVDQAFDDTLDDLPSGIEIISKIQERDSLLYAIKLHENISSNQLLNFILSKTMVIRFQEILPSMNDIFIEMVNKHE